MVQEITPDDKVLARLVLAPDRYLAAFVVGRVPGQCAPGPEVEVYADEFYALKREKSDWLAYHEPGRETDIWLYATEPQLNEVLDRRADGEPATFESVYGAHERGI